MCTNGARSLNLTDKLIGDNSDRVRRQLHPPTKGIPMRPRPTLLTLLIAGAVAVAGLGAGAAHASTQPNADDQLSFALLIGGPSTDGAIDVTVRDNLASGGDASLENAVREAAASGDFDLIVAHGFDLVPAVAK